MDLPADLHDAVVANPDDRASLQVLADWLQERSDPQGELIVLALAEDAGDAAVAERLDELQAELDPFIEGWILDWRWGYVRRAQRFGHAGEDPVGAWRSLLASGAARFVREIVELDERFHDVLLERPPRALRALTSGGGPRLAAAVAALPHLSRLRIARNRERVPIASPTVRELWVDLVESDWLARCDLPALARLRLVITAPELDLAFVDRFPALRELSIATRSASDVAAILARYPQLMRLDRLDVIALERPADRDHPRYILADKFPAEARGTCGVLVTIGRRAGAFEKFRQDAIVLGRGEGADVALDPPSRERYAVIDATPSGWYVSAGATVDGILVGRCELRHGDELAVGNTVLRFLTHDITASADRLRTELGLPARRTRRRR